MPHDDGRTNGTWRAQQSWSIPTSRFQP